MEHGRCFLCAPIRLLPLHGLREEADSEKHPSCKNITKLLIDLPEYARSTEGTSTEDAG
jgi:hypothetical protein